jgi:hypothetical protein
MNQSAIPNGRWSWLAAKPAQASSGVCHACAGRAVVGGDAESELEEEIKRPGLKATLRWSDRPYTYTEVMNLPVGEKGRGFYIAFTEDAKGVKTFHKVGQSTRSFRVRFKEGTDKGHPYPNWKFYLGFYPTGVDDAIEHAIARTLVRAVKDKENNMKKYHKSPRDTLRARGDIHISNLLPTAFVGLLTDAYKPGKAPAGNTLLVPRHQLWELNP